MTESPRRGGTVPPNPHDPEPGLENPLAEWNQPEETAPEQPSNRDQGEIEEPLPPED